MIEANDAILNHVVSDVFFKDVLLHSKDLLFILSKMGSYSKVWGRNVK